MKIVKLKNGKYAIFRFWGFGYLNINEISSDYWYLFPDSSCECSLKKAKEVLKKLKERGYWKK